VIVKETGLVLEGGGMRGLYTAGVLEYFMEQNLYFPYIIGVSAGACMAATYVSRQKGRNRRVNIDLVSDHRFVSFRNLLTKRQLFGMDFLFDEIPNRIVSFDFETFFQSNEQFIVGTTDCKTGKPAYFSKIEHGENMLMLIRASSSLPFIAPPVQYNGHSLLDGGLADPIPLKKSQQDGNRKNVIISTKSVTYQQKQNVFSPFLVKLYKSHPEIAKLLGEQTKIFNETKAYIESEKKKRTTFVIQPSITLPVRTIERNQNRLTELYELGYHDAKNQYKELTDFLTV
jgi:predicted patatin/cPLA2 family phospholipase